MAPSYFARVAAAHPNRLWINNPTLGEASSAIAAGAVSCTSNPTFAASMLAREPEATRALIDSCLIHGDLAGDEVQQRLIERLLAVFQPLFAASQGRQGWVAIQGDPLRDTDADHIAGEALRYRRMGANVLAKIPVTRAGLGAIERVLAEGVPVLATEIFAVSQALETARVYEAVCARTGRRPAIWLTHISGIFDDHLGEAAARTGATLRPETLRQAGCIAAHLQYRALRAAGFRLPMLGGGARGTRHFTEMVGGEIDVTLNWSTVDELVKLDQPVIDRLAPVDDPAVIAELSAALPEFARAIDPHGLRSEEFDDFGPVRRFRDIFVGGWTKLQQAITERRAALASHAAR